MKYPHLTQRLFNSPLLMWRQKLDEILFAISPRLGIDLQVHGAQACAPEGDELNGGRQRKPYAVTPDGIAVIEIIGPLVKRQSGEFLSGGPTTYGQIEYEFMDAATDPAIKGILLLVDSPGGEAVGCFELADMIYQQRGSKPIHAAVDGDAFSAAFAIASAAEKLHVLESGGVGSVGVYMLHLDFSGWNEKQGVKPTYIFAGEHKVDGNPDAPLSDDAKGVLQAHVDKTYGMFVGAVARNRKMSEAKVRKTEAALFFGSNGIAVGFADAIGTVSEALDALRASIQAKTNPRASIAGHNSSSQLGGSMKKALLKLFQSLRAIPAKAAAVAGLEAETLAVGDDEAKLEQILDRSLSLLSAKVEDQPTGEDDEEDDDEEEEAGKKKGKGKKAAALAYAADVAQLCQIAGMPGKAEEFIRAETPIEKVRTELSTARVAADTSTEIHAQAPGTTPGGGKPTSKVEDSPLVKAADKAAAEFAAKRK